MAQASRQSAPHSVHSAARLATPPARTLHNSFIVQAAAGPTTDGNDISTHNGTTSVSLSEGFKPFEEVRQRRAHAAIEHGTWRCTISAGGVHNLCRRILKPVSGLLSM